MAKYSYYLVTKGMKKGIYKNYWEALVLSGEDKFSVKGFNTYDEAANAAKSQGIAPGVRIPNHEIERRALILKEEYHKKQRQKEGDEVFMEMGLHDYDPDVIREKMFYSNNNMGQLLLLPLYRLSEMENAFGGVFHYRTLATLGVSGSLKGSMHKYQLVNNKALAPSPFLFNSYKNNWQNGSFSDHERQILKTLPRSNNPAWDLYKYYFKKQLLEHPDTIQALTDLANALLAGYNIVLVCYCKKVTECHLSLLGAYMMHLGYKVHFTLDSFLDYVDTLLSPFLIDTDTKID